MARKRTTETAPENPEATTTTSPSEGNGQEAPSDTNGTAEAPEAAERTMSNGRKPFASWRYPVDKTTNVQVALWPNTIRLPSGEEIEVLSMTISRSYKDKNGEWVNSRTQFSFRIHELPVLQHAIAKAYACALDARQQDTPF